MPALQSPSRFNHILPVVLAYVAGYVDGCTFVALLGLFVAQLTGSFAIAGAVVAGREHATPTKLLAIPAFVLGAAAATAADSIARHRKSSGAPILLGLEALSLAAMLTTTLNPDDRLFGVLIGMA